MSSRMLASEHVDHWRGALQGADPSPLSGPVRPGTPSPAEGRRQLVLPAGVGSELHRIATCSEVPVRALLIAVHLRLLASLTSNPHVLTAVVAEDTDRAEPAPLWLDVRGLTWLEMARQVHRLEREAAARGPVADLRRSGDRGGPAPDSLVAVAQRPPGRDLQGVPQRSLDGFCLDTRFTVDAATHRVSADIAFDPGRLHPAIVSRLAGYYGRALAALAADPLAVAAAADVREPSEVATVDRWRAGPAVPVSPFVTMPDLFRERALSHPSAVALSDVRESLRYGEVHRRVQRVAHRLRAMGVSRGDRVGVCVHRSADLVVSLLGVQTAAAAYVPLDPDFPMARLEFIARDADLRCVIAGPGATPPAGGAPVLSLQDPGDGIAATPAEPLPDGPTAADAAYVIYTSGSSGRPKGTVIEHRSVASFLLAMDRAVGISPDDRFLSVSSVSFDISVLEMLWPLARGASTVLCPERMVERLSRGATSLEAIVRRFAPTLFQATPSFFTALTSEPAVLETLGCLRALLVGGEALTPGLASWLTAALPHARILNMYGPTETTIWSTVHELDRAAASVSTIPIGRPIANTRLRLVDGLGNDACVGVPGELWIGGTGVARGYFRRPDLDAERFVRTGDGTDARYYRTGDLVRWRDDGELEFLGRNDRQVKLLGHRVELDEIESVLSEHPQVASAAVVVASHAERGHELVAYLVPRGGRDRAQRQHLDGWRTVWDAWYGGHRRGEGLFIGWLDRYTGRPFPDAVMRQWLDAWVERVRRLAPRRVVDVGAGAGLLLRSLPPTCDHYLAIDPSAAALDTARARLDASAGSPEVELRVGDAAVLGEVPDGSADVVVLNSVVQYFPDAGYLAAVLDESIRVATPAGAVFAGDVRDLRLLRLLHADVELHRAAPLTPAVQLLARVERLALQERELCLAPSYFETVAARHPGWTVRVESKGERARTEMSRFRYDVTILGPESRLARGAAAGEAAVRWRALGDGALETLSAMAGVLAEGSLVVTDVPNARLSRPRAALLALTEAPPNATAWDVARSVWDSETDEAADPADVVAQGRERGLDIRVEPARSGRETCVDVVFRRPCRAT